MERLTYRGTPRMTEDGMITPSYSDYPIRRIIERLADYEDAEEQGLLLRLPESDWNDLIKELAVIVANDFLIYIDEREFIINQIFLLEHDEEFRFSATCRNFYGDEICWECNNDKECPYSEDGNGCFITFSFSDIGKTVFLTKAEAEKALAEMGESKV